MLPRPVPRQSTRALAAGLAAAAIAGCGADLDLWTGAHLDYSSSPSLTACQGTHQYVDDFVPFLSGELGIDTNRRLEYQWLDGADFGDAPCRESIGGCARSVSLQVPTTGQYTLTVEGDSGVIVQAGPCFGCPWVAGDMGARGGTEITGELNAGPHYVRIQTPDDDSPDVRVVLRPVP